MKTRVVISLAVGVGCVIAFWFFSLAFTMSTRQFNQAAIIPILVTFVSSLILVALHPSIMKLSVIGVSGPILISNMFFFLAFLSEGGGTEWTHLITALKVIIAVISGASCGMLISTSNSIIYKTASKNPKK